MSISPLILAASGEDPTVKIIVGVIVAGFWIASQVFGALTKKPDRQLPPSRPPNSRPPPLERLRAAERPRIVTPPMPPRAKRQPSRRYEPPKAVSAPMPAAVRQPMFKEPAAVVAKAKVLPRRQMIDALLKPRNLRKAYVLNELLQPPVSMRSPID